MPSTALSAHCSFSLKAHLLGPRPNAGVRCDGQRADVARTEPQLRVSIVSLVRLAMRRGSASWRVRVYARSGPAGRMALLLPSRAVHARVCRLAGVPERLPERPTKCCPLSSHATRANKAIQRYYLRQKASKQRLVLRCAHSPYRRAQRAIQKSALRATLCSSLLQASGRSCKYLQQGTRKLPRRRGNRTARGAAARARRRQRRRAPRATARAPVAPRSPHG